MVEARDYVKVYHSPLVDDLLLSSDGEALTGLWFVGQKFYADILGENYIEKDLPIFRETEKWLDLYFSGKDPGFTPPLKIQGSDFKKDVLNILLTVPFGKTITYGELAKRVAKKRGVPKMSAQAIGGAVSRNSISIIIPCHRVVGANGKLTGYSAGLDKKFALLELEGIKNTSFEVL